MTTAQKGRIFISYRRVDTRHVAGRIYDRLASHFGEEAIFMDVEAIDGGVDFVKVLEDAVQSCDVLIALIGGQWLNIKDEKKNRRLDNPEDFVRIEIATALSRDIRVIPILVDGVSMPPPNELPENLKSLARRYALQVNHRSFNADVNRLISHLEQALKAVENTKNIENSAPRMKTKIEDKPYKFYRRAIHLEYRVNADAKVVYNYLLQNYTEVERSIKIDDVQYIINGIRSFSPEEDNTLQYGFVIEGRKLTASHDYYKVAKMEMTDDSIMEQIPEMFFVNISQGQKDSSILNFDTDITHAHLFTTELVRELKKAFKISLVH